MKDRTRSMASIICMGLLILTVLTTGCTQKDEARSIGMAIEFNDHAHVLMWQRRTTGTKMKGSI